jgi:DNA-binding ferritin-like protein (Dps family)
MEVGGATGSTATTTAASNTTATPQNNGATTGDPKGQTSPQAKGQAATGKAVEAAIRELGDADMDALVTVQVNGQAQKIPLRDAVKRAQLEQASQAKMREAAQVRNQAMQLIELAKENPRKIFEMTGKNPVEFAESILEEFLQEQQMSPEQKELRDLRAKESERQTVEKEKADQLKKEQFQKTVQNINQNTTRNLSRPGRQPVFRQIRSSVSGLQAR